MAEKESRRGIPQVPVRIIPGFSLIEYQDLGLSLEQKKQLEGITASYIREFKLPGSYDNLKKAAPVIAACVKDGLQKDKPEPFDDLKQAFKTGYTKRNALIRDLQVATAGLTGGSSFDGEFAIHRDDVNAWKTERLQLPFMADFPAGRSILYKIKQRYPLFQQLLLSARQETERLVPGSSEVKLTRSQEAGLVRNFLFSYVVYDEPRPLLEVGDYMLNGKRFIDETQAIDDMLDSLTQALKSPEAKQYLTDLAFQIAEDMKQIPQITMNASLDDIQTAYRSLQNRYLIENPFRKVGDLSDDPNSENNIWQGRFATAITLKDQTYRIPLPQTLMLLAYQKQAIDPARSSQLMNAAEAVNNLYRDLQIAKQQNTEIRMHEDIAARLEEDLQAFSIRINYGTIDEEIAYAPETIDRLTKQQIRILAMDLQLYPDFRKDLVHNRQLGWSLLEKYASGKKAFDEDKDTLIDLYLFSIRLPINMRYYVKKKFAERVRLTAEVYRNQDPANYILGNLDQEVISRTLLGGISLRDILDVQTKQWRQDFTQSEPQLNERERFILARHEYEEEKYRLRSQLRRSHYSYGKDQKDKRDVIEWIQANKNLFSEIEGGILFRMKRLVRWKELLDKGHLPPDISINLSFLEWRRNRDYTTQKSIEAWTTYTDFKEDRKKISRSQEKDEEDEKVHIAYSYVEKTIDQEYGPCEVILRALARLGPDEMLAFEDPVLSDLISQPNKYLFEIIKPSGKALRDKYKEDAIEIRKTAFLKFQDMLLSKGFTLDKKQLRIMLPTPFFDYLVNNAHTRATFFFLEPITQQILEGIQARHENQRKHTKSYLRVKPKDFVETKKERAEREKSRAKKIIEERDHRIEIRVRQLNGLGVIRLADEVR